MVSGPAFESQRVVHQHPSSSDSTPLLLWQVHSQLLSCGRSACNILTRTSGRSTCNRLAPCPAHAAALAPLRRACALLMSGCNLPLPDCCGHLLVSCCSSRGYHQLTHAATAASAASAATGSTSMIAWTQGTAGARDRGLLRGLTQREVRKARVEAAADARANVDSQGEGEGAREGEGEGDGGRMIRVVFKKPEYGVVRV